MEAKAETDSSSDRYLPLWAIVEQNWAWTGHRVYALHAEASGGVQAGKTSVRDGGSFASAYCEGQKEVVTEAHNRCNRLIHKEVQRLVEEVAVLTEDHEEMIARLWEREELREICPWLELVVVAWQQREEQQPSH